MKPPSSPNSGPSDRKSSIIVVIATNAPLLPHQLKRLARRAALGVARTGTYTNNDSGELFVAFSTANTGAGADNKVISVDMIPNDDSMDSLFEASVDAAEEAIINALVAAETMIGRDRHKAWGITDPDLQSGSNPIPSLVDVMKEYKRWEPPRIVRLAGEDH
jgi:D-aminopeptidase